MGNYRFPAVTSAKDIEQQINTTAELEPVGAKVFLEAGFGWGRYPLLSDELRQEIVVQTKQQNLPIYVSFFQGKVYFSYLNLNSSL
jgi:hypothetical protein